jgi:hypothetical protein
MWWEQYFRQLRPVRCQELQESDGEIACALQIYNRLQVMSVNFPVPQQQDGSYLTMFSLGGFEYVTLADL